MRDPAKVYAIGLTEEQLCWLCSVLAGLTKSGIGGKVASGIFDAVRDVVADAVVARNPPNPEPPIEG